MKKIIDNRQISWRESDSSRLNYQMIFEENSAEERLEEELEEKLRERLKEEEEKWSRRLHQARRAAFEQGRKKGRKEGLEKAREEMDEKIGVLEQALEQACREWRERRNLLEPGLIDLVFEITEKILDVPVENPDIRKTLEHEIGDFLQKVDERTKPVLWVSKDDMDYIEKLRDKVSPETPLLIRESGQYHPGEFKLDTGRETLIRDFKMMLRDFKKSLNLPPWS